MQPAFLIGCGEGDLRFKIEMILSACPRLAAGAMRRGGKRGRRIATLHQKRRGDVALRRQRRLDAQAGRSS